jgi:hypothetical protein
VQAAHVTPAVAPCARGPTHNKQRQQALTLSKCGAAAASQVLAGVGNNRSGSLVANDPAFAAAADAAAAAGGGGEGANSSSGPHADLLRVVRSGGSGGLLPAGVAARLLPVLLQLAEVRRRQKRFGEAEGLCRRALGVAGMAYPPNHPEVAAVKNALAQVGPPWAPAWRAGAWQARRRTARASARPRV